MSDLIESARRYRADLLAEIDRVDRFVRFAGELSSGAWPRPEAEARSAERAAEPTAEPPAEPAMTPPAPRAEAPEAPIQVSKPTPPARQEEEAERGSSLFRGAFSDGPLRDTG